MQKFKERMQQPATIWKVAVFIFGLGMVYSSLNYRILELERFQEDVHLIEIQSTLSQIKTDVDRIKNTIKTNGKGI
ncbi:MAG TPA: hypothetical protein PLP73_01210 [Candidatus Absconditabacterales bacterium]|nr:hypothetical protein [Candidatus Absconditabacterales bacterium]